MIGVISSGSWALALAQVLADNHHDLIVYSRSKEQCDDINNNHKNSKFFDVVINPKQIDCKYPFKSLCGAAVAYKFIEELYKAYSIDRKELP